jgi:hypothetical protein
LKSTLGDRLAVRDLRRRGHDLGLVLALHALDVDVEVQLAHAGDDRLVRLGVDVHAEGRVFLGEAVERLRHVRLALLSFGLTASEMTGSGTNIDVIATLTCRR